MEDYKNLESLNEIIGGLVTTQTEKMEVSGNGSLKEFHGTKGLQKMEASTHKYDCLLHSFLSATCPNFRKLDKKQKDTFADMFRREILPAIVEQDTRNIIRPYKNERIISLLKQNRVYLEDEHISLLCSLYGVKIVVFETIRREYLAHQFLPQIYGSLYSRNRNTDDVYLLYNPGNAHYEPVRVKETGKYSISLEEANSIIGDTKQVLANHVRENTDRQAILNGLDGSSSSSTAASNPFNNFNPFGINVNAVKAAQTKEKKAAKNEEIKAASNPFNNFNNFNPFNVNIKAVKAAQTKEKKAAKNEEINLITFPGINRAALAKREGLPEWQFDDVSDAQILQVFPNAPLHKGGARRRTRRRTRKA